MLISMSSPRNNFQFKILQRAFNQAEVFEMAATNITVKSLLSLKQICGRWTFLFSFFMLPAFLQAQGLPSVDDTVANASRMEGYFNLYWEESSGKMYSISSIPSFFTRSQWGRGWVPIRLASIAVNCEGLMCSRPSGLAPGYYQCNPIISTALPVTILWRGRRQKMPLRLR